MIQGRVYTELIGNDEQVWAQVEMIQGIAAGVADGDECGDALNGKLLDPGE